MGAKKSGMVWRCDNTGKVLEIVSSDFPDGTLPATGQPLPFYLDTASAYRVTPWFQDLQQSSSLLPNIQVKALKENTPFTLGATVVGGEIWLFWSSSPVEEMPNAEPNPPQSEDAANSQVWQPDTQHMELLEELSRVNNELVNARRELIRQNIELHRAHQKQLTSKRLNNCLK